MSVLVDTSVWSYALRKKEQSFPGEFTLRQLIEDGMVRIIGPIRHELLSGITNKKQFDRLKKNLSYFPDIPIIADDYERAADFYNQCRKKGIQGSYTDFLICSIAFVHNLQIFTLDKDFKHFQQILPIRLFD